MTEWVYTGTATNLTTYLPAMTTTTGTTTWATGLPVMATPVPETALDWLDREIERTCAVARAAA